VRPDPRYVAGITPAGLEVGLISVEGLGDSRRPPLVSITIAADTGNDASAILCLPEVENGLAVSFIEIIGGTDRLGPVAALAIGGPNYPCPRRRISPVPQPKPWADFLRRPAFLPPVASAAPPAPPASSPEIFARRSPQSVVSRKCPGDGYG
jgi:hypothetical protein